MDEERDDQRTSGHVVPSGAPHTGDPKNDPRLSSAAAYNENFHAVSKRFSKTVEPVEQVKTDDFELPSDSEIDVDWWYEPFSVSLPSPDIPGFDHTTGSGKYVCQPVEKEPGPVNERSPDECLAAVQFRTEGLSNTKEKTEEPLIDEDFEEPLIDEDFNDLGSQSSTQNQTKSAKNLEMSAKSSKRHNRSVKRKRVSERQHMSPNGSFLNQKKGKWKIIEKGTSRGGDVLYAPDGREYIRKRTSKKGIDIWRCRVRNKKSKNKECPAIVKQCGKKFVVAGKDHTH